MILQCSECKARYLVPDGAIGALGRTVRCAKCSHSWFQAASPEFTEHAMGELDKMLSGVRPLARGANVPALRNYGTSLPAKVAMFALCLAIIVFAVMLKSPGLLGFPSSEGLVIADLGIVKHDKGAGPYPIYEINGKISNITTQAMRLPTLRVTLTDKDGNALQYWDFAQDKTEKLAPGKAQPFNTGDLETRFSRGAQFVVELGNPIELALRRKP